MKRKLPLEVPDQMSHTWSMDFVSDALENGRKSRCFNILDDYNREALHPLIKQWSQMLSIEFIYAQLGKPTKNTYIERFNRTESDLVNIVTGRLRTCT